MEENSVAIFVRAVVFDKQNKINTGIEGYCCYENKGITFSLVDYRDPETGILHHFITTLPESINPGSSKCNHYG